MPSFEHFVLTRFNVRESADKTDLVLNPVWLQFRFDLFERFCWPSVRAQTTGAFTWLVFFDKDTPEPFRARTERYAGFPPFRPVFVELMSTEGVQAAIERNRRAPTSHLITTRLDNDDGLCVDFIQRVQAEFRGQRSEVINFTYGYVWRNGRIYWHADRSSPFASLIECTANIRTVWARWHTRLSELAPIIQVADQPMWLQVVHGANVRNRTRGVRQPAGALRGRFVLGSAVEEVHDPLLLYLIDRHVLSPARNVRESLIHAAKRLGVVRR